MLRFGETKVTEENFYAAQKSRKPWEINVHNIATPKVVKRKTNSKYFTGYSHTDIRPLVLIMPKMKGYVKAFKHGDKDKNNKLMSFCIDDEKLLEKHEAIWTKIEDLKNLELHALPVYDDRYIKTKIRKYGDKVYTNFCGLNVPEDNIEYESFTVISTDSLLVYENKYYLPVYLDDCAYKTVNKEMTDYLDENLFED